MLFLSEREKFDFAYIYKSISGYLSKGYAVIYSAELDNPTEILRRMVKSGILPDAEDYIQNRMLSIVDQSTIRSQKTRLSGIQLADLLFSTAADVLRKVAAKRVLVMCNTEVLLDNQDYDKQIEFEQAIHKKFENDEGKKLEVVCCYPVKSLEKTLLRHLIVLLNAHQKLLNRDWEYTDWRPSIITEIITKGMNDALGEPTTNLILRTFKLIYKIDENAIISNPAIFEETLEKVIGREAAETTLAHIASEMRRQILL